MAIKTGPLTRDDLRAIWSGALDKSYRDPLLAAGDGQGLEPHSNIWNTFGRVSEAVDRTTQAVYLLPGSGQTNPCAEGGAAATVQLTFTRERRTDLPIYLQAGFSVVVEETEDWSENGGVTVRTGRRYVLTESVLFHPGETGPKTVWAQADRVGYGYNNPLPGTLRAIEQFGAGFENNNAVISGADPDAEANLLQSVTLTTENVADMFIPEQVGQYIEIVGVGVARIIGYTRPDSTVPRGAQVILEQLNTYTATVFAGTFAVGDVVVFSSVGAPSGVVVGVSVDAGVLTLTLASLTGASSLVVAGDTFAGPTGTGTVGNHLANLQLVDGPGVVWRVLDWAQDLGVTVTNPLSPTGGRAAFLDEIGRERDLPRGPGEGDDIYRARVSQIADVVSPNAIKRTLNRILGVVPWCFREVGTDLLPGFFYDAEDAYDSFGLLFTGALVGVFVDNEPTVVETAGGGIQYMSGYYGGTVAGGHWFSFENGSPPSGFVGLVMRGLWSGAELTIAARVASPAGDLTRWKVLLNWAEFRGFFLVCLPRIAAGEFGMPYDDTTYLNAYDAILNNFYDGYPTFAPAFYGRVWQALDAARAGGVGFDLCLDNSCV